MNLLINQSFKEQYNQTFRDIQDRSLSIKDRSGKLFEDIVDNNAVKEQLYRALSSNQRINVLLNGDPSTSKTMFLKIIEDYCNNTVFYDFSTGSTGAGLLALLAKFKNFKGKLILLIDEISRVKTKKDLDVLLGLLEDGRVTKILKSEILTFRIPNLCVIATTNSIDKLDDALKSRFQIYHIDSYDDEQFIKVLKFCLRRKGIIYNEQLAEDLAYAMLQYDVREIRKALSICSLIDEKEDNIDDVKRVIENYLYNQVIDQNG